MDLLGWHGNIVQSNFFSPFQHHLCQIGRSFKVVIFGVWWLNETESFPGFSLLIVAGNMMISLGDRNFTFFVDLDFGLASTIFFSIVAAPISSNFLPDVLSMKFESFMKDGTVKFGFMVFFVVVHDGEILYFLNKN